MKKVLEAREAYFNAIKSIELAVVAEENALVHSFLQQYPEAIVYDVSFYYPASVVIKASLKDDPIINNKKVWHLYNLNQNETWTRWS